MNPYLAEPAELTKLESALPARASPIFSMRVLDLTGFTNIEQTLASLSWKIWPGCIIPDSTIAGIGFSDFASVLRNSTPEVAGIWMSVMMRSNGSLLLRRI